MDRNAFNEVKQQQDETSNEPKNYPFSNFRVFKSRTIGNELKRPIIRPNPIFHATHSVAKEKVDAMQIAGTRRKTLIEMGYGPPNSVGKVEQVLKSNRDKRILNILENQLYPDVVVNVGNETFHCHNILLQLYSDFFKSHHKESTISIEAEIRPDIFEILYEWMLQSMPLIPRKPLMELISAASILGISDLMKSCWHCLDADRIHLREDQAVLLYMDARRFNLKEVQTTILKRICKFFLTFVACKEFLDMECDEVITLLSSNNICVNTELEVLLSAARWINYDYEERKPFINKLLECVRFSLLPAWYLLQLLNNNLKCLQLDWIVLNDTLLESIQKSFIYSVTQQQFGYDNHAFQTWCIYEGIRRPFDRKWIYDKGCIYHHRSTCPRLHVITYDIFECYLHSIRDIGVDYWHCIEWSAGGKNAAPCCSDDCNQPTSS